MDSNHQLSADNKLITDQSRIKEENEKGGKMRKKDSKIQYKKMKQKEKLGQ